MADTTTELQRWLDLLNGGDDQARLRLIGRACERLRLLARKMLRGFPVVRGHEQTDDVLQNSMLRLHRTLGEVRPESLRHFFALAGQAIRRELLDLAKRYRGIDARVVQGEFDAAARHDGPADLAVWTEFHEQVEALPEAEREVTTLIWYEQLTQEEAAAVLGVSSRTVLRRWHSARLKLHKVLHDDGS